MRILFFSDYFSPEPSPPAAHVFERARLWVQAGHQVTVLCTAPNYPEGKIYEGYKNRWRSQEQLEGIRVVRVKSYICANEGLFRRSVDFGSFALSSFFFAFFETKPDIVISTSPHLLVPLAGLTFAKFRRLPHVFELRDLWPASLAAVGMRKGLVYRLLERMELALYRGSKRILAFTQAFIEDLSVRGIPREKMDLVLNGANLTLFTPRSRDQELAKELGLEGRFVVGFLGTLGLPHSLEHALDAASLLQHEPVSFLFVGGGTERKRLMELAASKDLNNVVFVERQLKEAMPRYWSLCDASLIQLRNSPLFGGVIPSKIFESMAMGLPILFAVPKGEGSAIVEKHGAGICLPPGDAAALADAIRRLAGDEALRRSLSKASLAAAPSYSREKQAEACLEVFRKAIGD
jgi:colanic acid biosynthesis glycosyl transferase WcaI